LQVGETRKKMTNIPWQQVHYKLSKGKENPLRKKETMELS
jgi:hypothetical protein